MGKESFVIIEWEKEWDKIYKQYGEVQSEILPSVKMAVDIFRKNNCKEIMDLGCGTGRHTIFLAQNGFSVIATDISVTGIETTKSKADSIELKNIKYVQHDMRKIPFDNDSLDGILCVWTTGHGMLIDIEMNIIEIYRVLKPNGVVVIDYVSTADANYSRGERIENNTFINNVKGEEKIPHHYSTKDELEKLYVNFARVEIIPISYVYGKNNENTIKAYLVIAVK